jgi:tight adherence protein C
MRTFGRIAPQRNAEMTRQMLLQAGEPFGLQVVDFFGIRLLAAVSFLAAVFLVASRFQPVNMAILFAVVGAVLGFLLPVWWLKGRAKGRAHAIQRALPDALDMLTIGVEAGLAFETAMLRVGDKWHNPLTSEFRRAIAEMRVGTARETALQRMADRCGVADLSSFIAVLVQSSQLGVSIGQVLHSQAGEMRLKRRQRAEELARQAGVKMVFPLVLFIFPSMFVVILGPAVPDIMASLNSITASTR